MTLRTTVADDSSIHLFTMSWHQWLKIDHIMLASIPCVLLRIGSSEWCSLLLCDSRYKVKCSQHQEWWIWLRSDFDWFTLTQCNHIGPSFKFELVYTRHRFQNYPPLVQHVFCKSRFWIQVSVSLSVMFISISICESMAEMSIWLLGALPTQTTLPRFGDYS